MDAFTQRIREDELMDQPELDADLHRSALHGLRRVNRWSRTAARIWKALRKLARKRGLERLRVLDLACGGGDICLALASRARSERIPFVIHGWDKSQTSVNFAAFQAKRKNLSQVGFYVKDVLQDPIEEPYDFIISTLFLHHLEIPDARRLLHKMRSGAKHAVLIDDLRRTRAGYALAWLGTRLLSRSPIVHADGPMSVRAAFTCDEMRELAESAGMLEATIECHWPQRSLVCWERG